ncbi:MAG: YraN family protein [Planctomycetota bacterium]
MSKDPRPSLGRRGERLAAIYLRLRGYTLLARNLKTPAGEIDLLLRRGCDLVICEVKSRRGRGEAQISFSQRRRLARAAEWVLAEWGGEGAGVRIDLVRVEFPARGLLPRRIRHWPEVFGEEILGE